MRRHSEATAALQHSWQLKQQQEEEQQQHRQEERQQAARAKQQHEQLIEVATQSNSSALCKTVFLCHVTNVVSLFVLSKCHAVSSTMLDIEHNPTFCSTFCIQCYCLHTLDVKLMFIPY